MKKVFIVILLLASCSSLKQDQKNLAKIQVRHPELILAACPEPKEVTKYLPGVEVRTSDTVVIKGKKIPCPPNGTDTVWQDCPPSIIIHDTITRVDTVDRQVENTAGIKLRDAKILALQQQLIDAAGDLNTEVGSKNGWRNTAFVLGGCLGLGVFLKLKKWI